MIGLLDRMDGWMMRAMISIDLTCGCEISTLPTTEEDEEENFRKRSKEEKLKRSSKLTRSARMQACYLTDSDNRT